MAESPFTPALFVTWQAHASRKIFPVGRLVRLTEPRGAYEFVYVRGALEAVDEGFAPFIGFPSFEGVYRSHELPPFFRNRVMASGRPDYASFVRRLALLPETATPDDVLARSGGVRATDTVELFAEPVPLEGGRWQTTFFVRSVRHLREGEATAASLSTGQRLFCLLDIQNPIDRRAVALRTDDKRIVGYCPAYLTDELDGLLARDRDARVEVLALNPPPTPVHYRILCDLVLTVHNGTPPFRSPRLEPIASNQPALIPARGSRVA